MDHVISHIIINGPLDLWSLATKGTQELMELREAPEHLWSARIRVQSK